MKHIHALPTEYAGITFRSTLEADWAYNLDVLEIPWSYEPWAVQLPNGIRYLADFYLEPHRVWLEVKGDHNERIHKTRALHKAIDADPFDWRDPLVVIGRAPLRGRLTFHGVSERENITIFRCPRCDRHAFINTEGTWQCRICGDWNRDAFMSSRSGALIFERAPRPNRAA